MAENLIEVVAQWEANSEYNKKAREWARKVVNEMRSTSPADRLRSGLKYKTRTGGAKQPIRSIAFAFDRLGIYIEKGAGRGHGGLKGSKWTGSDGRIRRTNPASLGKMDKGARPAKPFLQPAIDRNLDELADIAAEYAGDMVVAQVDGIFKAKKMV